MMTERPELSDSEKYDALLDFVKNCAGDGYLNTRGTAKMVLEKIGEKPYPRDA